MHPTTTTATATAATTSSLRTGVWSDDEHERFVDALQLYPNGPWKSVAEFVGTRTVRQVQTHAQKYHEKAARRLRDLRQDRERYATPEPTIDLEMQEICASLQRNRVPLSPRSAQLQERSIDRLGRASVRYFRDHDVVPPVQSTNTEDSDTPSFDECIDFLIEAFASTSARRQSSESGSSDDDSP